MSIIEKIKSALRRRPVTDEEVAGRAAGKAAREQMLSDRVSQESRGGEVYRSERRD